VSRSHRPPSLQPGARLFSALSRLSGFTGKRRPTPERVFLHCFTSRAIYNTSATPVPRPSFKVVAKLARKLGHLKLVVGRGTTYRRDDPTDDDARQMWGEGRGRKKKKNKRKGLRSQTRVVESAMHPVVPGGGGHSVIHLSPFQSSHRVQVHTRVPSFISVRAAKVGTLKCRAFL